MNDIVDKIATLVNEKGGTAYYVGGFVRDLIRGYDNVDLDIEVHGIDNNTLLDILSCIGEPLTYGKSFGIYSLKNHNIDIAMPRIEHNTGYGHKDFEVYVDPYIDLVSAIKRRDFTINAIYKNILTQEIIDPFNGIKDIENKIIRHIDSNSFSEDPLRVLRACQFASRFNYEIDPYTIDLCKNIDIKTLSKQRVFEELKKALLNSEKPSIFFNYLKTMNQLDYWFNNINTKYIDEAIKYIDKVNNPLNYLLTVLTIDSSYDLTTLTDTKEIIDYSKSIINNINTNFTNDVDTYKLFYNLKDINDYIYVRILIDSSNIYLLDKYEAYKTIINKPYITGQDLIAMGHAPGEYFNDVLEYANELRFKGIDILKAKQLVKEHIESIKK